MSIKSSIIRLLGALFIWTTVCDGKQTTALGSRQGSGNSSTKLPRDFGMILFQAFDTVDVFGPVDVLQFLARSYQLNLHIIAETMDPVSTAPLSASMNPMNSSFWPAVVPTHTFDTAPDLDVLIVPGGPGMRNPNMTAVTDYIAQTYPSLQYLITVCTGAGLAARSGVLDGRRATTNKFSWSTVVAMGPKVKWVAPARWVIDGNIWSSSGETAGIDTVLQFVRTVYPGGVAEATQIAGIMEYVSHDNSSWDPFAAMWNVTTQNQD